jgi:hypothetical protein
MSSSKLASGSANFMELKEIIGNTRTLEWILLGLFMTSSMIQLGYYLIVYIRLPLHKPGRKRKTGKGIL